MTETLLASCLLVSCWTFFLIDRILMGNSTSQPQDINVNSPAYKSLAKIPGGVPKKGLRPPSSSGSPASSGVVSPSGVPGSPPSIVTTHHSMRHKKKSLELPDLAPLALSPASGSGSTSKTEARSAPIEIPSKHSKPDTSGHHALKPPVNTQRPRTYLTESTQQLANREEPSTHIPIVLPPRGGRQQDEPERGRSRREARNEPNRPSTRSRTRSPSPPRSRSRRPNARKVVPQFQKETLRSALPTFTPGHGRTTSSPRALMYLNTAAAAAAAQATNEDAEVTAVQIVWRGGARQVVVEHADESEWSTAMHHQDLVPMYVRPILAFSVSGIKANWD